MSPDHNMPAVGCPFPPDTFVEIAERNSPRAAHPDGNDFEIRSSGGTHADRCTVRRKRPGGSLTQSHCRTPVDLPDIDAIRIAAAATALFLEQDPAPVRTEA